MSDVRAMATLGAIRNDELTTNANAVRVDMKLEVVVIPVSDVNRAIYLLGDLSPNLTAILKALGAGAIIAMAAETMVPEAFHNGPRYSGLLAALGFAALILLSEVAK